MFPFDDVIKQLSKVCLSTLFMLRKLWCYRDSTYHVKFLTPFVSYMHKIFGRTQQYSSIEINLTAFHRSIFHYSDVIMGTIASQITSITIVYSTIYSDADQRTHQSSASLAFVWGIHRGPVNSPHKWPVKRKMFPFDDVIMVEYHPLNK